MIKLGTNHLRVTEHWIFRSSPAEKEARYLAYLDSVYNSLTCSML